MLIAFHQDLSCDSFANQHNFICVLDSFNQTLRRQAEREIIKLRRVQLLYRSGRTKSDDRIRLCHIYDDAHQLFITICFE